MKNENSDNSNSIESETKLLEDEVLNNLNIDNKCDNNCDQNDCKDLEKTQNIQTDNENEFNIESAKTLLNQHIDSLLKVFICEKERHKQIGALCVNLDFKENNTYYTNIEMLSPKDPMRLKLLELYKKNYNIAVFYLFDKKGELYSVLEL